MAVNTAERLLNVIRALNDHGFCTVSQLQKHTGCSRQSVYRLLDVLLAKQYVVRLPDQPRFYLGPEILKLTDKVKPGSVLETISAPILTRLQRKLIWPTSLVVFDKGEMVVRHSTRRNSPFDFDNARVGFRIPVLQSAAGLAYLAYAPDKTRSQIIKILRLKRPAFDKSLYGILNNVKRVGYSIRRGGRPYQTSSIAVPIVVSGSAMGSIVVSYLTSAMGTEEALKLFLKPLQAAAAEIAQKLEASVALDS